MNAYDEQADARTVQLLRQGEPEGLRRLLFDHAGLIGSRLRREFAAVLDDSEVEEAMSRATVRAWNAAGRFDPTRGTLRAWMLVIARRCALRVLEDRRRHHLQLAPDLDHRSLTGRTVPPSTAQSRLHADVRRCIEQLPPLQRAVLQADLEADGVAAAGPLAARHGTTTNSIYVSRLKARRSLRTALARLGHRIGAADLAAGPAACRGTTAPTGAATEQEA